MADIRPEDFGAVPIQRVVNPEDFGGVPIAEKGALGSPELLTRIAGGAGRRRASAAADILRQQDPGIDYSGINDPSNRAVYSLMSTPGEKLSFLKKQYGAENVSTDSFGHPLIKQGDKLISFEPRGTATPSAASNIAGYADIAGQALPVGGMVAGAIGGAPLGPGGSIAGAGLGAAAGESINQIIKNLLGYRQQSSEDIAKDIVMQVPKGAAAETIGQGVMLAGRSILAPYAERSIFGPNVEAKPTYREQMTGVDAARAMGLTPQVGAFAPGAPLVQRAQNAGFRLFGNPLPLRNRPVIEAGQQDLLNQFGGRGEISPNAVTTQGERLSTQLSQKAESVAQGMEQRTVSAQQEAHDLLKQAQNRITSDIGESSGKLATSAENDIRGFKDEFRVKSSELYKPVDELIGKPVVPNQNLKDTMLQIIDEGPKTADGRPVFASDAIKKFASDVAALPEFSTFQQMQVVRSTLRDRSALDALNAGLSERQAARLASAASQSFDDAVSQITTKRTIPAGSIVGESGLPLTPAQTITKTKPIAGVDKAISALRRADQFYAAGSKRFNDLSVEALVKDATQTGYIQPEKVAQYIATPGQVDKLMRIKKVVSPDTFMEVGNEKWTQLVGASEDSLTADVSGKKLADRLNQMGLTLDALYGPAKAGQMRTLAKQLAALDGKVDISVLGSGDITTAIKKAVDSQAEFKNLVNSDYINMIRGEGKQSLQAADWLTNPANRLQLRNVIRTFGADSPEVQSLKEYLARKIFVSMEVPAAATEAKFGSTVLMGEPLKDTLKSYGKPYLEEVFGKEWSDKVHKFADTVEIGTRRNPQDSGGLAAAAIGLRWPHHLMDLAKFYSIGWATAKSPTITYMTKGMPGFQDTSVLMEKLRGLAATGTRGYIGLQIEQQPKQAEDYAMGLKNRAMRVSPSDLQQQSQP